MMVGDFPGQPEELPKIGGDQPIGYRQEVTLDRFRYWSDTHKVNHVLFILPALEGEMLNATIPKLSMDHPESYEIVVPGFLYECGSDWADSMTIKLAKGDNARAMTILKGVFDQSALLGLLRTLYSRGIPLISVHWMPSDRDLVQKEDTRSDQ